ncbi:MAG: hypothetical protein ACXACX_07220 [Candidatus Hodarchaeales archaeon]
MYNRNLDYKPQSSSSQSSNNPVLVCEFCGAYNLQRSDKFQICNCNSILILEGQIQPNTQIITNCKMCSLLAVESGS